MSAAGSFPSAGAARASPNWRRSLTGARCRWPTAPQADKLVNLRLYANRERLPPADGDEFYLADLVGLQAVDPDGKPLGPRRYRA